MKQSRCFFLEFSCFLYNPMDVGNLITLVSAIYLISKGTFPFPVLITTQMKSRYSFLEPPYLDFSQLIGILYWFAIVKKKKWFCLHVKRSNLQCSNQLDVSFFFFFSIFYLNIEKNFYTVVLVSDSSQPHGLQPTRILHPWDFPGKSTGVGCHRLLQFLPYNNANQP